MQIIAISIALPYLIRFKGCSRTRSCRQLSASPSLVDRSGLLNRLRPGRQLSHVVSYCRRGVFLLLLHGRSVCWCCVSALLDLPFRPESLQKSATSSEFENPFANTFPEAAALTTNSPRFLGGQFAKEPSNLETATTPGPLVNASQPPWKPDTTAGVEQLPQYYPQYGGTLPTAGSNGNAAPYSYYPNR